MNTVQLTLVRARQIITPPEAWTQGEFARDKDLRPVAAISDEAVCFCGFGANERAVFELFDGETRLVHENAANRLLRRALRLGGSSLVFSDFNDTATHAEVLAVFDKAIEETS